MIIYTYTGGVARKRASSSPDAVEGVATKRRVGELGQEDLVMTVYSDDGDNYVEMLTN